MDEQRFLVTDRVSRRIEAHLPEKTSDAGATAKDNRLFLEAVFWRVRTGSPWRDLAPAFGNWNTQFRRFRRWAERGIFESLFNAMKDDPNLDTLSSTALSPRFTRRRAAQKGDSGSGHRALARRADYQDRGAGGCAWKPCAFLAAARPGTRHEGCCAADQRRIFRCISG